MTCSRGLCASFAVLVLSLAASQAHARPRVAVLGLEVKGEPGAIDATSTTIAHELTQGLRLGARDPTGRYALAPSSDRELIDQKLIKDCDDEAPTCMAAIGHDLGADLLIYGRLEKDPGGYLATLYLLDVGHQKRLNTTSVRVPADAGPDGARALAERAYADLIGERAGAGAGAATGILVVHDDVDHSAATGELAPGRHDDDPHANPWKPAFGVSGALAVGLGVVSLYAYVHWHGVLTDRVRSGTTTADGQDITPSDCGGTSGAHAITAGQDRVDALCTWYHVNLYTGVAAGVLGAGAAVFGILAYTHGGSTGARPGAIARRNAHPRAIGWAPLASPELTGGMVRVTW